MYTVLNERLGFAKTVLKLFFKQSLDSTGTYQEMPNEANEQNHRQN